MQILPCRCSLGRSGWVAYLKSSGDLPLPLKLRLHLPDLHFIFLVSARLLENLKAWKRQHHDETRLGRNITSHIAVCSEAVAKQSQLHRFLLCAFRTHSFRLRWCMKRRMNNILTDHFLAFTLPDSTDVQTDNSAVILSLFFGSLIHSNPDLQPLFYLQCSWKLCK